jgi:hypothetical protein
MLAIAAVDASLARVQSVVQPELDRAIATHLACARGPDAILHYAELISCTTASGGRGRAAQVGTHYPFRADPWPNEEEMKRSRYGALFERDAVQPLGGSAVDVAESVSAWSGGADAMAGAPLAKRQRAAEPPAVAAHVAAAAVDESLRLTFSSDSEDED